MKHPIQNKAIELLQEAEKSFNKLKYNSWSVDTWKEIFIRDKIRKMKSPASLYALVLLKQKVRVNSKYCLPSSLFNYCIKSGLVELKREYQSLRTSHTYVVLKEK